MSLFERPCYFRRTTKDLVAKFFRILIYAEICISLQEPAGGRVIESKNDQAS
jgi:hypothetical protein